MNHKTDQKSVKEVRATSKIASTTREGRIRYRFRHYSANAGLNVLVTNAGLEFVPLAKYGGERVRRRHKHSDDYTHESTYIPTNTHPARIELKGVQERHSSGDARALQRLPAASKTMDGGAFTSGCNLLFKLCV